MEIALGAAVVVGVVACYGARRAGTSFLDLGPLLAGVVAGALLASNGFFDRGSGVTDVEFIAGLLVALLTGFLLIQIYYWMGRLLAGHPIVLGAVWLVSLIPAWFFLLVGSVVAADLSHCGPDSYECPV